MKSLRVLSFSSLPELQSASIFTRLSSALDGELLLRLYLKEFHERAQSSIMFFFQMDPDNEPWRNEARVRAGLNEFYSLEDAARRGFRISHQANSTPTLSGSAHPLVHVMYSLRHINVHVKSSPTLTEDVTVTFRGPMKEENITYPSVMLNDETKQHVLENGEVRKYYVQQEMEKAMDWLLEKQKVFGLAEIFRLGTEAYCREVIAATALPLRPTHHSSGTPNGAP